jgi:hypothetical protein
MMGRDCKESRLHQIVGLPLSVSSPPMLTVQALLLMNTQQPAALGTGPFFIFVSNKMPYPVLLDVLKIVDHAHAILGSIPPIQVAESGAWKAVTTETIFDFGGHYLLAVFDAAHGAQPFISIFPYIMSKLRLCSKRRTPHAGDPFCIAVKV